ncbi:hypothetical protein SAMN05660350_03486 [Geodermatophilus obscurus]|uniref:Uncharacterized protein n=1 Tax=Geodermatophilus obscurus TaxID=1861 RepID=A0A1M7ULG2_9ACTN|nr:hypothetical protein [Geodermatophilus obscurus]SHN83760.1 hypothetical protein SAMN05660350_03486 [Geodermatophilus obscurus]
MTSTESAFPIEAGTVELRSSLGGRTFVPGTTPLIGLNYYDGRALRADDLNLERRGQRRYVEYSDQAGGPGLLWGFEPSGAGGPVLGVSAGLAVAPKGQLLHLPAAVQVEVADLLPGRGAPPPAGQQAATGFEPCTAGEGAPAAAVVPGTVLYTICLAHATGLCGHAEVFGRLCDGGCVTAADRPYVVDGVTVLLRPLQLDVGPFCLPGVTRPEVHLCSQVAAAYFAQERARFGSALSAAGIGTGLWGAGAPNLAGEDVLPIGVLGWDGAEITLLDQWTARRERMEPPARLYWAGRVEQRPWPVFLAQVLQFQAQLAAAPAAPAVVPARELVERGFVELPAAGYLPVDPGGGDLRAQVQDLVGPGVELRLCAVRRDQIPHELERAQHMDRISLLRGLADPGALERVDVLVPDGLTEATAEERTGLAFAVDLSIGTPGGPTPLRRRVSGPGPGVTLAGAVRLGFGPALTARLAVAGTLAAPATAAKDAARLVDLLAGVVEGRVAVDAAVARLTELAPTGSAVPEVLDAVAGAVRAAAAALRAASQPGPVHLHKAVAAQSVALSLELSVSGDPFELSGGDEATAELTVEAFHPRGESEKTGEEGEEREVPLDVFARRRVRVALRPDPDADPASLGTGEVALRLEARLYENGTGVQLVEGSIVLGRLDAEDGRRLLTIRDPGGAAALALSWQEDPVVDAWAVLGLRSPTEDGGDDGDGEHSGTVAGGELPEFFTGLTPVATARALEATDVVRPGNASHDAAVDALTILSGAHVPDAGYAETQIGLLFPPERPRTGAVQATTDWVLFRRRRREECEGDVVLPAAVDPVTVWVLRAGSEDEAAELAAGIAGGSWSDEGWQRVDVVFADGAAMLLTPDAVWRNRYEEAGGGAMIVLARYAPAVGAQPAAAPGLGRLAALAQALAPKVTGPPAGAADLAQNPPGPRLLPGTDGSAFLVTVDPDPEVQQLLDVRMARFQADDDPVHEAMIEGTAAPVGAAHASFAALNTVHAGSADEAFAHIAGEARSFLFREDVGSDRRLQAVEWVHQSLPDADRAAVHELVERVIALLRAEVELRDLELDEPARVVGFERGEADPVGRLYLVVLPRPIE